MSPMNATLYEIGDMDGTVNKRIIHATIRRERFLNRQVINERNQALPADSTRLWIPDRDLEDFVIGEPSL